MVIFGDTWVKKPDRECDYEPRIFHKVEQIRSVTDVGGELSTRSNGTRNKAQIRAKMAQSLQVSLCRSLPIEGKELH